MIGSWPMVGKADECEFSVHGLRMTRFANQLPYLYMSDISIKGPEHSICLKPICKL